MSSVFLSYSHADRSFAVKLARDLRRHGHVVWLDDEQIQVGDSLIDRIRDAIDRVDFVAAVISSASIDSEWVKRELDVACNREIEQKNVPFHNSAERSCCFSMVMTEDPTKSLATNDRT